MKNESLLKEDLSVRGISKYCKLSENRSSDRCKEEIRNNKKFNKYRRSLRRNRVVQEKEETNTIDRKKEETNTNDKKTE